MTEQQRIVTEITKNLHHGGRSLAVLAGAGISMPSGLPSGNEIVKKIVNQLFKRAASLGFKKLRGNTLVSVLQTRPEIVFDVVQGNYKLNSPNGSDLPMAEILSGFKGATPNGMHYFLAQSLATGKANVVITTNYDTLIEQAFQTVSIFRKGSKPRLRVVATQRDLGNVQTQKPYLFKIHGSLDKRRAASPRFAVEHFASIPEEFLRKFQQILKTHDLLVLGYSGRDDFSLKPLLLAPPSNHHHRTHRIFWIEHLHSHADDIFGLQTNPPREIIRSRDTRFQHKVPSANVLREAKSRGSVLLTTETEQFVEQLAKKLGFRELKDADRQATLDSFDGLDKWFGELDPHIAVLSLSQLAQKTVPATKLRVNLASLVKRLSDRTIGKIGMSQMHFECAMLCKDSGDQRKAQSNFKSAYDVLTAEYRARRSIPPHIKDFAHRIQMMWGFSLKDEALVCDDDDLIESKLFKAYEKFSESSAIFGRSRVALAEAPWVWIDLAQRQPQQQQQQLFRQTAIKKWELLIKSRSFKGRSLGEIHYNLSWAYLDLASIFEQWPQKIERWWKALQHIDASVKIYSGEAAIVDQGKALRTECIQRARIAGELLLAGAEIQKLAANKMKPSVLLDKAIKNVEEASELFSALGDISNQVFTIASRAWLAYAESTFPLGDRYCKALQSARKTAPLSGWQRDVWISEEINRLRAFKARMIKAD